MIAVDISIAQLNALRMKYTKFDDKLEVRLGELHENLMGEEEKYDIVVANAFLHHLPDYLGLIRETTRFLNSWGQFFSFQDPLRYDSVSRRITMVITTMFYFGLHIFQGDVLGGLRRRIRRSRGIYLEYSVQNTTEYHATRNGFDQEGIQSLFEE